MRYKSPPSGARSGLVICSKYGRVCTTSSPGPLTHPTSDGRYGTPCQVSESSLEGVAYFGVADDETALLVPTGENETLSARSVEAVEVAQHVRQVQYGTWW